MLTFEQSLARITINICATKSFAETAFVDLCEAFAMEHFNINIQRDARMTTLAWDKTILDLMKQLILVASHSDYNDEAFSTIYSELFKSLRLYPRYKNMLQAYRQTNSIAEIVELTRKILDGQCGQQ